METNEKLQVDLCDVLTGCMGLWLLASPSVLGYTADQPAVLNAWGTGAGVIVFCLMSACRLEELGDEIVNVIFGAWLLLAPFALGFAPDLPATANSMATGLIVMAIALWDLRAAI